MPGGAPLSPGHEAASTWPGGLKGTGHDCVGTGQTSQELDGWLRTNCAKYFTPNMEEWLATIGPRN